MDLLIEVLTSLKKTLERLFHNKIISEGQTADSARKKALKKTDAEFLVTFVPKKAHHMFYRNSQCRLLTIPSIPIVSSLLNPKIQNHRGAQRKCTQSAQIFLCYGLRSFL